MGRKIGLDVGDKTIGVAVSDELGWTAQGVTTIERVGIKKDTTKVVEYIKEYDCDTVVVGLPKKLDGTDSPQTEKVRLFAEKLSNKMRSSGLKTGLEFYDERFTSVLAHQAMIDGGLKKKARQNKALVDEISATIILQDYMRSRK